MASRWSWLTGPLDSNGDVDYLEAINLRCAEGVTTENNAFVKLFQVIGPIPNDAETTNAIAKRLGIDPPQEDGDYFQEFEAWLVQEGQRRRDESWERETEGLMGEGDPLAVPKSELEFAPIENVQESRKKMERALSQYVFAELNPWSSSDFPEVEKWRKLHEPLMNVAREGIDRSHYYYPLVSDGTPRVMNASLYYTEDISKLSWYFSLNAMNRLHEGDVDGCIEDLKSQFRLGIHISKGPTLVEELRGIATVGRVLDGVASVCASEKADAQELKNLLRWVNEMEMIGGAGQRVDQTERFVGLDAAVSMARGNMGVTGAVSSMESGIQMFSRIVEWEEVLQIMNANYDRMAEAAKIEDPQQARDAQAVLEQELIENEKWVVDNMTISALKGRRAKGIWLGRMLSGMLLPAADQIFDSENANKTKHAMLKMAIAASIYKKENGQYPAALSDLVPQYLDALPADPMEAIDPSAPVDKPFEYQVIENGIRIQSTGWSPDVARHEKRFIELRQNIWEEPKEEDDSFEDSFSPDSPQRLPSPAGN